MQSSRLDVWEASDETYSERQIESVLDKCDIEIVSETGTHFLTYCPFHDNMDSPAFLVNKIHGAGNCMNPSCDFSGGLEEIVRKILKYNPFQAQMLIIKCRKDDNMTLEEKRKARKEAEQKIVEFGQDKLDELYANFKGSPAQTYMYGRGFEDETLDYFRVGYSPAREYPWPRPDMVIVPMHDIKGMPIGLIGRSIVGKEFKNSKKLPKRQTAWNIHRAKREGAAVIVVESSFDAMRVHQAGYPNVVALLGGHVSEYHLDQMNMYFSNIIIMTDFENGADIIRHDNCRACGGACKGHRPGRDLGRQIARGLPDKRIFWAAYDDTCIYPHNAKDCGDMTDDEIRQCLKNAVSNSIYKRMGAETPC